MFEESTRDQVEESCQPERIVLFETARLVKEVFASLITFHMRRDELKNEKEFLKDLKKLIVNLVEATIEEYRSPITRGGRDFQTVDVFIEEFADKHGLNDALFFSFILENLLVSETLSQVAHYTSKNPFNVYRVNSGLLLSVELIGDYRIIEWEREHIDTEGKYDKHKPSLIEAKKLEIADIQNDIDCTDSIRKVLPKSNVRDIELLEAKLIRLRRRLKLANLQLEDYEDA